MRLETLLPVLLLCAAPGAWAAEESPPAQPQPPVDPPNLPGMPSTRARPPPVNKVRPSEGPLVTPAEKVDANDLIDEMVSELAADLAMLGAANVSPILLERIRLSDNVHPEFAAILEARMVAAIQRAANILVLRCMECFATRGRIEDGAWIVSRGFAQREDLARMANKYQAKTILTVGFTLNSNPNSMAMDVEVLRPEDAAITFAEGYRVHPQTAILYRAADRAQKREARLKDLEDRLAQRPQFGQGAYVGAMMIPSDDHPDGPAWGAYAAFRFFEKWGVQREWRMGVNAGGFLNPGRLTAGLLSALIETRVTPDNVYMPTCYAGGGGGFLVRGTSNNSGFLSATVDCVLSHRIALQASINYVLGFKTGDEGYSYGGISPQLGVAFIW
jgi:hypothetical protein